MFVGHKRSTIAVLSYIEDTAITEELFGYQYDIHGGARDLIFPHHEAEIAQMETISGKSPLVNYWMHIGFLNIGGEKMAKSEGNFITVKDALSSWTKETFRLFVLTKHYRSPIEYNEASQEEFFAERGRIEEFVRRLNNADTKTSAKDATHIAELIETFWKELDDDFNTPKAFAALFEIINTTNVLVDKEKLGKKEAEEIFAFLVQMNDIFGIAIFEKQKISKEIQKLADERESARKSEDWEKADELRKNIEKKGYIVKDTSSGPVVSRK